MDVLAIDPERPDPAVLEQAAEAVLRGGIIAFPTDTLYGLSCSLVDASAVALLYRLKRRPPNLSVISLIPEKDAVYALALEVPGIAETLMRRFWPGPLSLIFRASPLIPEQVRGTRGTIALRYPDHRLSLSLLEVVGGPLVSSSANLSGGTPATSASEVLAVFGNQIDLVLDGGNAVSTVPSTVVDVSGAKPELVRAGAVDVSAYL